MLRALSPGNDVFSFSNNYPKKALLMPKDNSINKLLPIIKITKDQTTGTEDIKPLPDNRNFRNINPNFIAQKNFINNKFNFNEINNGQKILYKDSLNDVDAIKNNNIYNFHNNYSSLNINKNNKNPKIFFNKNFKLKSIEKAVIKSNSSINILTNQQSLTVINIPSNNLIKKNQNTKIYQSKSIKRSSSSLPKINFGNKISLKNSDSENNKCNFLYLKYNGSDNSKINNLKNKKIMVINPHKVIESLQSLSMPDDNYGKKLIDILENRINSGYYRNIKYNFGKNYENQKKSGNFNNDINPKIQTNNKKIEKKKFSTTFLTDIYDDFLLPDKDNKYNYIIHKIFLTGLLNKICKKMIEIRDVKNRLITKQEIRDEYCNQLEYLRDALYNNKKYNIINNNIYNINSNTNIINIDLSNNNSMINEMSTIEELQENSFNINTTIEGKDKDKQNLTSQMLNLVTNNQLMPEFNNNNIINILKYDHKNLENVQIKYKSVSKNENKKLLNQIRDNLKIKNKDLSLHDNCSNIFLNKSRKGIFERNERMKKIKNLVKKNLYENNYITSLTETYYREEQKLNNVDKFLLNTNKIKCTININEKEREGRNYSYDLEGNIHHSFQTSQRFNIVNFDEILDEIQHQYNINNNIDLKLAKIQTIKEILRYYFNNKNYMLKFSNEIIKKFLSIIIPSKSFKNKYKKYQKENIKQRKKKNNILEDISKKMHKKIKIKGGKLINYDQKESKIKKHYNTEDAVKERKSYYHLTDINSERQNECLTDNIYLEIETNSSEYTDVPSDLDSEIEEMIRKKKEREKEKEGEEIYSQGREEKHKGDKGGDFIIKQKDKNIEKEKNKNIKQNTIYNNKTKEENYNDNKSLKDENTSANFPDKDLKNYSNIYLNSNIDEYLKKNESNVIENTKSFKGNKQLSRRNTFNLTKSSSRTNITKRKSGIVDMKLNLDRNKNVNNQGIFKRKSFNNNLKDENNKNILNKEKKSSKNIDINNLADLHKKKITVLEKIIEEEAKETKKPKVNRDSKGIKRKKTKIKTKRHKNTIRKDIKIGINDINNINNNKNSSSVTSDYEQYTLNNDINSDNKSNIMPISSKYNDHDIKENNKNLEEKEKEKEIIKKDDDKENEKKKEKEKGEESSEEEKNEQKNNSFYGNRPQLSEEEEGEKEEKKMNNTLSYFFSILKKLDELMLLKKNKKEEKNEREEKENEDEEKIGKRKRFKRKKKKIKIKGAKELFMDENNEEIKNIGETEISEEEEVEEIKKIPKKIGWEERFELFKQYIKDLEGMTGQEFIYNSLRFLKENDKDNFSRQPKFLQEERINRYKEFLAQSKVKRINYNQYYSSQLVFTPGCIFNTGEVFK